MKKALAGPAKPGAKKKPERGAMIAARRRRHHAPGRWLIGCSRRLDRGANRVLSRVQPPLARWAHRIGARVRRWAHALGKLARPIGAFFFRCLARGERLIRRVGRIVLGGATRASAVLTPARAICAVTVATAACLIASQFIVYRSVQIGPASSAGLPAVVAPPSVASRTAGQAHSFLLIPVSLLAAALALAALRPRRRGLARLIVVLGLGSVALILLVDRPSGLNAAGEASQFAGAHAVLRNGFYAELAAAAGLVLSGLLYYARPCRIPINLSGRVASGPRRRRRRRASSRGKDARRASPPRSGEASAPASPR